MKTKREKFGFTLVELLTVMSVIAILIGLLVPALNLVRKMAKDTSQKAQLHSIGVSLDIYNGEMDGYPNSSVEGTSKFTVGAQHLAEALIGRDMLGYDPQSSGDAEKDWNDKATRPVYGNGDDDDDEASLARRKGPYLSSENVEAYDIGKLYPAPAVTNEVYDNNAPVLTDNYRTQNVQLSNGKNTKAGSPILYYKANTSLSGLQIFPDTNTKTSVSIAEADTYIYNSNDNEDLIILGKMTDNNVLHHYDNDYEDTATGYKGRWVFYDTITNPKITSQPRPYNASTYLLISAGYDGIYGTTDDITNFGE